MAIGTTGGKHFATSTLQHCYSMTLRRIVDRLVSRLLVILMGILVLDVLWQVASRYLFKSPSSFTDELAGFLLIWVGLLGAAYAVGLRKHLAIDYFVHNLSASKKKIINILQGSLIVIFCLVVMIVGGIWLVYTRFYLGQLSPALQLPLGYVYVVVPVSGALIIYYSIDNMINELKT